MLELKDVKILPIDDDELHIKEHTSFLLSIDKSILKNNYDEVANKIIAHIEEHKKSKNMQKNKENS